MRASVAGMLMGFCAGSAGDSNPERLWRCRSPTPWRTGSGVAGYLWVRIVSAGHSVVSMGDAMLVMAFHLVGSRCNCRAWWRVAGGIVLAYTAIF